MSKLWKFLNTPLIVVLIAMLVFPVLTVISSSWAVKLGVRNIAETVSKEVSDAFNQNELDNRTKKEFEAYENVSFSNIGFAPKKWGNGVKVIGTFTNNHKEMIKSFDIGASLYEGNRLVNYERVWSPQNLPENIAGGESANFSFDISLEEDKSKEDYTVKLRVLNIELYD